MEFLKYLPGIFNSIFDGERIVKGWKIARIYPIHKNEDETEVKNYRGVSLLDSGYKLYASILEKILRFWLKSNKKMGAEPSLL